MAINPANVPSPLREPAARPAWQIPLFVFLGSAAGTSFVGSLLVLVIWFFRAEPDAAVAPPSLAQNTSIPTEPSSSPASNVAASDTNSAPSGTGDAPPPANSPAADTKSPEIPSRPSLTISDFPVVELPGAAVGFAFDAERRLLAMIGPWPKSVGLVAVDELMKAGPLEKVEPIAVTGEPTAVTFVPRAGGTVLVVGQKDPDIITVLDCAQRKPLHTISSEKGWPRFLCASSNPERPFLYTLGGGAREVNHVRVDLTTMKAETLKPTQSDSTQEIAISADGKIIYVRRAGSPASITATGLPPTFDDANAVWGELGTYNKTTPPAYPHPNGRYVASGNLLFDAKMTSIVKEMQFDPRAFFTDLPWMAGNRGDEFVIGSFNDGKPLASIALPEGWLGITNEVRKKYSPDYGSSHYIPGEFSQIFADQTKHQFVFCLRERIVTFPLERFGLPAQPYLAVTNELPDRAMVGTPYKVEFKTVSGKPNAEISSGPEGLKAEGNSVVWTPTSSQIGKAELKVRLTDGATSHSEVWQVRVGQHRLEVPYFVRGCEPSTDGKQVAVWGHDWPPPKVESFNYRPPEKSYITLIDVARETVIASTTVDAAVGQVELNAHGLFAANSNGFGQGEMVVMRLSVPELKVVAQSQLITGFLTSLADKVMVSRRQDDSASRLYALPSLKPIAQPHLEGRISAPALPAGRVVGGWLMEGVLWDEGLKTPKLIRSPPEFMVCPFLGQGPASQPPPLEGFGLRAAYGPPSFTLDLAQSRPTLPAEIPAAIRIKKDNYGALFLDFVDIKETILRSVQVREASDFGPYHPYSHPEVHHLTATSDRVFYSQRGSAFVIPVVGENGAFPQPFHVLPQQSTLVLASNKVNPVQYQSNPEATRFELLIPALSTSDRPFVLESATGKFDLDVREAAKQLVNKIEEGRNGQGPSMDAGYLAKQEALARNAFRQLVGRQPNGMPYLLEVFVRATSKDLAVDVLPHAFLLELPLKATPVPPGKSNQVASRSTPAPRTKRPPERRPEPAARTPSNTPASGPTSNPPSGPSLVDYAESFRRSLPAAAAILAADQLATKVEATNREVNEQLSQVSRSVREWTDRQGRKIQATFVRKEQEAAVVNDARGRTLKIPLERLSDADQAWVQSQIGMGPMSDDPVARIAGRMQLVATALLTHAELRKTWPPAGLVSTDRKPLLSWRVLILSELGYPELASAFRYDEPWDSEHNRKLIPLMPAVFASDSTLAAQGQTQLVSIVGQQGMLSTKSAVSSETVTDSPDVTLLLVETAPHAAPVWTRPQDIPATNLPRMREVLESRDNNVLIGFADRSVKKAPRDLAPAEWQKLFDISDGEVLTQSLEMVKPTPAMADKK